MQETTVQREQPNAVPGNQGFIDLHNDFGLIAVIAGFIITALFIVAGGIFAKAVAREEKKQRTALKDAKSQAPVEK